MKGSRPSLLRRIPSVDSLISSAEGQQLIAERGRPTVVRAIRHVQVELREELSAGSNLSEKPAPADETPEAGRSGAAPAGIDLSLAAVMARVRAALDAESAPSLRPAINAMGVIIHTGLGRAVLAPSAREAIVSVLEGYCTLATDIESGKRGDRDAHLNALLCRLTGAEASTVVNNNAAATVLILNTIAKDKEVIVSRGQLVEIGGSFRMPDVMRMSGAILREVGTTNKTHLRDYEDAINDRTGAILRVHHSNYRIVGFAEEPGIDDLAALGKKHSLPVIDDLGSGALVDLGRFGLEPEPLVQASIRAGATVACFSGDKLIGGPQSGIIVGEAETISRIKKNPLKRALRVGKLTIAALEATLKLFLNPDDLPRVHPVYAMLALTSAQLERRARRLERSLKIALVAAAASISNPSTAVISVEGGESQVGSGSVPAEFLPTKLLCLRPLRVSAEELALRLRRFEPPVFARVHKEAVWLDLRTVRPAEDRLLEAAILKSIQSPPPSSSPARGGEN
jgi:L-seryl-tRNA(Ser) seleniumtransferase